MLRTIKTLCLILIIGLLYPVNVKAQQPVLNDKVLMDTVGKGIYYIYNFDFDNARKVYNYIETQRPEHPVGYLFYGLLVYWESYPLTPMSEKKDTFLLMMDKTIEICGPALNKDENNAELVFYDLVARGMKLLFYTDNGESAKTIKNAPSAYRGVVKSFDLKNQLNEFYYFTGLYNYYIEAYPEKHPVYKPLAMFFMGGNKQIGLEQLHFASDSTIFLRSESSLFLSLIYFNFENNQKKGLEIMKELHETYPDNPYYISKYVEMLLSNRKYQTASEKLIEMVRQHKSNRYIVMKGIIFKGILNEKAYKDYSKAKRNYNAGIRIAQQYGYRSEDYQSYAYYGLSRIAYHQNETKEAKGYEKIARDYSKYDHFSDIE